jgi:hypothetical protein
MPCSRHQHQHGQPLDEPRREHPYPAATAYTNTLELADPVVPTRQRLQCLPPAPFAGATDAHAMSNPSTMHKLKEEFLKMVPPTLFFFIALHVVALVRSLMTQGTGLPPASTAQIALSALILGKAVLLADMLPAINRFPDKPLAYNVIWKTVLYFVAASLIHYLERLYDTHKEVGSLAAANEKLLAQTVWPHFWGIQIVILVVVLNYCAICELGRALGEERIFSLFFRDDITGSARTLL